MGGGAPCHTYVLRFLLGNSLPTCHNLRESEKMVVRHDLCESTVNMYITCLGTTMNDESMTLTTISPLIASLQALLMSTNQVLGTIARAPAITLARHRRLSCLHIPCQRTASERVYLAKRTRLSGIGKGRYSEANREEAARLEHAPREGSEERRIDTEYRVDGRGAYVHNYTWYTYLLVSGNIGPYSGSKWCFVAFLPMYLAYL